MTQKKSLKRWMRRMIGVWVLLGVNVTLAHASQMQLSEERVTTGTMKNFYVDLIVDSDGKPVNSMDISIQYDKALVDPMEDGPEPFIEFEGGMTGWEFMANTRSLDSAKPILSLALYSVEGKVLSGRVARLLVSQRSTDAFDTRLTVIREDQTLAPDDIVLGARLDEKKFVFVGDGRVMATPNKDLVVNILGLTAPEVTDRNQVSYNSGYTLLAGTQVKVWYVYANQESEAVPESFVEQIALSSNAQWGDQNEAILWESPSHGPLPGYVPGQSFPELSPVVTIPQNRAPGNYYILLKIDPNDTVTEINEANNVMVFPVVIPDNLDLKIGSFNPIFWDDKGALTTTLDPGKGVIVSNTLEKVGSSPIQKGFENYYYFSKDTTWDGVQTDPYISYGIVSFGAGNGTAGLDSQGVVGVGFSTLLPSNLLPGTYYTIIKIDSEGVIPELNETNNIVVSQGTITVRPPADNHPPVVLDQYVETEQYTQMPIHLQAQDADNHPLAYTIVNWPEHGILFGNAPDLIYVATQNGYTGTDILTYKASDTMAESSLATVTIGVEALRGQTPWKSNTYGTLYPDATAGADTTCGYRFTPLKDGLIRKLGGFFKGTKELKLWDAQAQRVVASVKVTSTVGKWVYGDIPPVTVKKDKSYVVSVEAKAGEPLTVAYLGSGASAMIDKVYGDIKINVPVYRAGSGFPEDATLNIAEYMDGEVDVVFVEDPLNDGILTVGGFGSGKEYRTIQSAIDAIPSVLTRNMEIWVYQGTYAEKITVTGKDTGDYSLLIKGIEPDGIVVDWEGGGDHVLMKNNKGTIRVQNIRTQGSY